MVGRAGSGRFTLEMCLAWKMKNFCVFKNFLRSFLKILGGCLKSHIHVEGAPYASLRSQLFCYTLCIYLFLIYCGDILNILTYWLSASSIILWNNYSVWKWDRKITIAGVTWCNHIITMTFLIIAPDSKCLISLP